MRISKNYFVVSVFIVSLFLANISIVYPHEGGHYHHNDGSFFKIWTLKSGGTEIGNFSSGDLNYITLEQEEGRTLTIPFKDLCAEDQSIARIEIDKIDHLNEEHSNTISNNQITVPSHFLFYLVLIIITILLYFLGKKILNRRTNSLYSLKFAGAIELLLISFILLSFNKNATNAIHEITKTSINFINSAFEPYKPEVTTHWDNDYFYISSTGIPQHNMMEGIVSWQQQVPLPQNYSGNNSWSIPLQPVFANSPLSTKMNFMKGAVAIAVNGVPIFNALNNRGDDAYAVGELDNWGGHCGRADDYHYHVAPLQLETTSSLKPIAFALDGFPVYGHKEPDGSPMQPLDNCHGHFDKNGGYHYHGTTTYPYVIGAFKGVVHSDPSTPAPENQIIPQAFASPIRPAERGLRGAKITAFTVVAPNKYKLTYQIGTENGYVEYEKIANNQYQFIFTDPSGTKKTSIYEQKTRRKQ